MGVSDKDNKPEVKRYACKEPEGIIRVHGIEYIYKYKADEQMQNLRDKIKAIFRWCDGKFRLIKKLEKRIHKQRLALRKNWEIVRTQQAYRKTPLKTMWFDKAIAVGKENKALRDRIKELEEQLEAKTRK